jgi:hypothetical protein
VKFNTEVAEGGGGGAGGHGKALLSTEDAEGTEERGEKKEGKSIVKQRGRWGCREGGVDMGKQY